MQTCNLLLGILTNQSIRDGVTCREFTVLLNTEFEISEIPQLNSTIKLSAENQGVFFPIPVEVTSLPVPNSEGQSEMQWVEARLIGDAYIQEMVLRMLTNSEPGKRYWFPRLKDVFYQQMS